VQPERNQPQVDSGFQQMPGPGMLQRMHRHFFVDTGTFQCTAQSGLYAAVAERCCGIGHVCATIQEIIAQILFGNLPGGFAEMFTLLSNGIDIKTLSDVAVAFELQDFDHPLFQGCQGTPLF